MENVLIISGNKTASETIGGFIQETFRCRVRVAVSGQQARDIFTTNPSWELAVINYPLPDENGMELAEYICKNTPAGCILIVRSDSYDKLEERADKSGVILMSKPFSKQILYQIVKAVDVSVKRSWSMYEEIVRLEKQVGEIKLIDKAKFMLMEYKNMTEQEAHSYLEQSAMKSRKKKTAVASEIIDKLNEQFCE